MGANGDAGIMVIFLAPDSSGAGQMHDPIVLDLPRRLTPARSLVVPVFAAVERT